MLFNSLRPRQYDLNFADDTFKCFFLNEKVWISIKSSLKLVPTGPINNIPAFVQIMAWRWSGDKPLSEPMLIILLTHICVTRPQWVNVIYERNIGKGQWYRESVIYFWWWKNVQMPNIPCEGRQQWRYIDIRGQNKDDCSRQIFWKAFPFKDMFSIVFS